MAQRFKREILPATKDRPQIELVRSARRTRTISMQRDGVDEHGNPAYRLLIPAASTSEEIDEHIARLLPRIQRRAARRERATQLTVTDEYLRPAPCTWRRSTCRSWLPRAGSRSCRFAG